MTTLILLFLILILISLWIGFYAFVKQQGRILLRLDRLEQKAGLAATESPEQEAEPEGLPAGTDFPAFKFPDLAGKTVALEDFRGKRVLLVHWSFQCGFCDSIAPELARLEASLGKANVALVLLAYGDAASNQKSAAEHGLKCPILLLGKEEVPAPFVGRGTPVAYLLDEEGRVAAPFANGAERVLFLASSADLAFRSAALPGFGDEPQTLKNRSTLPLLNPKSRSADLAFRSAALPGFGDEPQTLKNRSALRGSGTQDEIGLGDVIKRVTSAVGIKPCAGCERRAAVLNRWLVFSRGGRPLKPGKRAPLFRLPDLKGRLVSLEEYQGRRALLVFTDPQCGPCDELAPHLVRLHQQHANNGLALILVGRGDPEENHRKAELHRFQFPFVLQEKWKLSKEYGTFSTPVAFLIGEDGVIAKDVAVGPDAILALARAVSAD